MSDEVTIQDLEDQPVDTLEMNQLILLPSDSLATRIQGSGDWAQAILDWYTEQSRGATIYKEKADQLLARLGIVP